MVALQDHAHCGPAEIMISLDIADIVYSVTSKSPEKTVHLDESYRDFHGSGNPEVAIRVHSSGVPEIPWQELEKVFDSEMVWSLYRHKDTFLFALRSPASSRTPYSIAVFDSDFTRGDIYLNPPENTLEELPGLLPLAYPMAEALMICLLARGRGVMMHAGGVIDNGRGYLFAARSSHGKTTMIKLWRKKGAILNDDRIIVRHRDNRFWIHGTPWHGEYDGVSSRKAPLEKIFILGHGEHNHVEKIQGAHAVSKLMSRCFPPFWDKEGMEFTVDFLVMMIQAIPCHCLKFKPDKQIVDFVRCVN